MIFLCKYGNHFREESQLDMDTSLSIGEFICGECSPHFWEEYIQAVGWSKFSTTGWVTCASCGKKISEGWQHGKLGEEAQEHFCFEHVETEVN